MEIYLRESFHRVRIKNELGFLPRFSFFKEQMKSFATQKLNIKFPIFSFIPLQICPTTYLYKKNHWNSSIEKHISNTILKPLTQQALYYRAQK